MLGFYLIELYTGTLLELCLFPGNKGRTEAEKLLLAPELKCPEQPDWTVVKLAQHGGKQVLVSAHKSRVCGGKPGNYGNSSEPQLS